MKRTQTSTALPPTSRSTVYWTRLAPLLSAVLVVAGSLQLALADEDEAAVEKRLADAVRYLASDELEGRGIGTKGLELAADYIARQFAQLGLKTELFDGTPFQHLSQMTMADLGAENELALVGPPTGNRGEPESVELKLGEDFCPTAASGAGSFDLPLVFVGYGITAKEEQYDDYGGVDVAGKAVVMLSQEPQQADPESVFNGTRDSPHALLDRKLSNAREHGAAAVILCTDQFQIRRKVEVRRRHWQRTLDRLAAEAASLKKVDNPTLQQIRTQHSRIDELLGEVQRTGQRLRAEYDPVLPFRPARRGDSHYEFAVVHCRRAVLDRAVKAALDTDLAKLERQIDQELKPHSRPLTGWRAIGRADVIHKQVGIKNVVAVLEGEGPTAQEAVVVGAHYDHLGKGGFGSTLGRIARSLLGMKDDEDTIYSGADDNASGVAAMIEIARNLASRSEKLRRRVVFIAFTGEERGLLGSGHYVCNPLVPLEKTVAMVNLDMVGRLRDEKLIVSGSGTAVGFEKMLDRINQGHGLKLTKTASGFGPSDHTSFYGKKIPVMHFFTDRHSDVHRPSDDFETLNISGMRRVTRFAGDVVVTLANAQDRPEYVATGRARTRPSGQRPYLGTVPDFGVEGPGYALSSVVEGGPAQQAGLAGGDVIIRFGQIKIGGLEDIDAALRKHKPGDKVPVVARRGEETLTFEVTLDPPR